MNLRDQVEDRFRSRGGDVARAVGERAAERAREIAEPRIEHPSPGGYLDAFEAGIKDVTARSAAFVVVNKQEYASFVEDGREPGNPVLKAYKDNAHNRQLGRVGNSYVHRYTGMPPSGIFKDGQPDWARRFKIARDGIPPRYVLRDLRIEAIGGQLNDLVRAELGPALFGAAWRG